MATNRKANMTPRDEIDEFLLDVEHFAKWANQPKPVAERYVRERAVELALKAAALRSALSRPAPATEAKCASGRRNPVLWQHDETGRTVLRHEGETPGAGWRPVYLLPTPRAGASEGEGHGPGACLSVAAIEADRAVAGREQDEREAWIRAEVIERCAKVCEHRAATIQAAFGHPASSREAAAWRDHAKQEALDCAHEIRALRPTPPPAEVEAKRREFYEACRRYEDAVACVDDFPDDEEVDALNDAKDARRDACNAKNDAYRALLAAERAERETGGGGE